MKTSSLVSICEINDSSLDDKLGSLKTEWLTTEDAARHLGISQRTLLNLCSNGQVPYYKFGRRNRYIATELDELLRKERRGLNGN